MLDPKQCYNHAKFEGPPINSVCPKANLKVFVKSENMSITSLEYAQKWKIVVYSNKVSSKSEKCIMAKVKNSGIHSYNISTWLDKNTKFSVKLFYTYVTLKYINVTESRMIKLNE